MHEHIINIHLTLFLTTRVKLREAILEYMVASDCHIHRRTNELIDVVALTIILYKHAENLNTLLERNDKGDIVQYAKSRADKGEFGLGWLS